MSSMRRSYQRCARLANRKRVTSLRRARIISAVDQLKLLGVALGLACLAGLNLYLTVFVTGLAIHLHWIVLAPEYQSLALLGDPIILWISGTLYVVEFFADKIPWVDSAWDTVHTIIRPIGGALLAIRVLGQTTPVFDLAVALAAGGASLVTHSVKASTRLVANTSPEPFSNVGLSLLEDAAVVGGLALIHYNPALALAIFVLLLSILLYFAPKIFRAVRVKLWLIWKKLNGPAGGEVDAHSRRPAVTLRFRVSSRKRARRDRRVGGAVCRETNAAESRRILPACSRPTNEDPGKLFFIVRRGWRAKAQTLNLTGCVASRESKFLSENLVISSENGRGTSALFLFERGRGERVQQIVDFLNGRLTTPVSPPPAATPNEAFMPAQSDSE